MKKSIVLLQTIVTAISRVTNMQDDKTSLIFDNN